MRLAAVLGLLLAPCVARGERRYFLLTYTPDLDPAGESEVGLWLTSKRGKQDPAESPTLESRAEWEYALTDRLTGAAYLNFRRPPGGALHLESPSLELIWRPAALARVAGGPAAYLEATESGDELELEPKLLLGVHRGAWVAATNLIGEFEFRHDDTERLANGEVLHDGYAAEITAGLARRFGGGLALGVEARARGEHPNFGPRAAALLSLGPAASLALGPLQIAFEYLPQLRGDPATQDGRNLVDFEATQLRALVSLEL